MATSRTPSNLSAEEKRKAAALRKKEKAEREAAEKAKMELERAEKEKADKIALQEAMAAAALEWEEEEGKETSPEIVTPPGKQDDSRLVTETGKDPEESPEKKRSKTSVGTPVRSTLKNGRYTRPSTPAPKQMHLHELDRIRELAVSPQIKMRRQRRNRKQQRKQQRQAQKGKAMRHPLLRNRLFQHNGGGNPNWGRRICW
jgi:hypothetical protein